METEGIKDCVFLKPIRLKEEQEEIDDDEEQALARRTGTSTEHGLITISQYR